MPEIGSIYTIDELEKQLQEVNKTYEGLKTWEQMYGSIDLQEKQAISSLTEDYSSEIGEAYMSSLQSAQNIMSSNIGQGYKEQALQENEQILQEAYNSYLANYQKNIGLIQGSGDEAEAEITEKLRTEATNVKSMQESAYNYLTYLYENYSDNPLFQEELWKRYLVTEGEETRVKTWEELKPELYDSEDNLTIKGADFYDQMMNQITQEQYSDVTDYFSWLQSENKELYDWATSYNPYDYSAYIDPVTGELKNTNLGSFRTMVGLTSSDQTYAFIERYGGMTEKEIDNMFDKFKTSVSNINTTNADDFVTSLKDVTKNIKKLADELGISSELSKSINGWDNLTPLLTQYITNARTDAENIKSDLEKDYYKKIAAIGVGTGITAAATGWIPIVGWFVSGMSVAAGAGLAAGVTASYQAQLNAVDELAEQNAIEQSRTAYNDMIVNLINFAKSERRKKEIEFNQK